MAETTDPIANLGAIKALASHFLELTSFYIAQWLPYHTALKNAAIAFVFPAGLVWFAFNASKMPADKGKAFLGGVAMLALFAVLLSPSQKAATVLPGASLPSNVEMASGSVWAFGIGSSIYKLFKSATDKAAGSDQASRQVGLLVAYEMNTAKVSTIWDGTPLEELYINYVNNCTRAVQATAKTDTDVKLYGYVGLLGGSGIGWKQSDLELLAAFSETAARSSSEAYGPGQTVEDNFVADKLLFGWVGRNISAGVDGVGGAWNAWNLSDSVNAAKAKLEEIPAEDDPFDRVSQKFPQGFKVPTEQFWRERFGATASGNQFFNGASYGEGKYLQPELKEAPETGPAASNQAFYPNTCAEAYELTNLAVAEYRKGWAANPDLANRPAEYAETEALNDLSGLNEAMLKRAEALRSGNEAQALNSQSQQNLDPGYKEAVDGLVGAIISAGETIFQFLLQYKMPFFISTMAMMLAALIICLPIFITMSVFLGMKILVSYVKLVAYAFTVILINDAFLSMGADLIANTNRMQLVYTIGNIRDNGALEIASATAKIVVLLSITAIELVLAKMLIWDDVKGMGGFSPASAAGTSFLATAAAIGGIARFASGAGKVGGPVAKTVSAATTVNRMARSGAQGAGAAPQSVIGMVRATQPAAAAGSGARNASGGNLVPPRPPASPSAGPSAPPPSTGGPSGTPP